MSAVDIGGTLDAQIAAHMRLYYGWLSARYNADPCKVYEGICALPADGQTRVQAEAELASLRQSMSSIAPQASDLNWRSYMQALAKSNPTEYQERIKVTSAPAPLSPDEEAYYQAWLNPPKLSPGLMGFFDTYVHDSRAGFTVPIVRGMYLTRRLVIDPSGEVRTATQQSAPDTAQVDAGAWGAGSGTLPRQSLPGAGF
jgi:hypothetical protein